VAELSEQPAPRKPEVIDRIAEIEQLAALDPVDYEATRGEAAERLNLRVSFLDHEVEKKRRALGLGTEDDKGQGRAVKIADPLPWHEPVGGDMIATALVAAIKVYAVLSDEAAVTIALWILHTWTVDHFTTSPRLAVTSPTKGCGKTTILRLLNRLSRRPKRAGSISPPALFRLIELFQPTILLDETEKYVEHGGDLHGLLNEGHCKGGNVLRVLGEKLELREFGVYGPVAFARNGKLPDDLELRSIVVEMKRRLPDEPLSELRDDRCASLDMIARKCARWADDNFALLVDRDPDMGGLINRVADNWRPLFAIADVIGFDWPERIRLAALALAPRGEGTGPMLLADIKAAFDDKTTDRLSSVEICEALAALEGRPWAEWKAGKPLTPNQLARLWKPFGVIPDSVRIGDRTPKGYRRHQFVELWQRYLAAEGTNEPQHRNNPDEMGTSFSFQSATAESDVADQKCKKLAPNGHCCGVAVQKGDTPSIAAEPDPDGWTFNLDDLESQRKGNGKCPPWNPIAG
jgi:putative DNA primase/helicase